MKKIINGTERNIFIEIIEDGQGDTVFMSSIKDPTEVEVTNFLSNPCDHKNNKEQLIYDVPAFYWNFRYCAVCGCSLGGV